MKPPGSPNHPKTASYIQIRYQHRVEKSICIGCSEISLSTRTREKKGKKRKKSELYNRGAIPTFSSFLSLNVPYIPNRQRPSRARILAAATSQLLSRPVYPRVTRRFESRGINRTRTRAPSSSFPLSHSKKKKKTAAAAVPKLHSRSRSLGRRPWAWVTYPNVFRKVRIERE